MGERFHPRRKKTPSFSSSLLDAIFLSIDESHDSKKEKAQRSEGFYHGRKQDKFYVEEESANDKWMQNYIKGTRSHRQFNSDSSSSAESSLFSSIETEPAVSRSGSKKHEGRLFMTTKSKALKIYKDLKKVRQPISPGGKFTNFLNSFLFNTKNLSISGIKSRPVKDSNTKSQTLRPCCLDKQAPSSANKSKRSVTFCPAVSVIIDEGHKNIYDDLDYGSSLRQSSRIRSECVQKSIERFRDYGVKHSYEYGHIFRGFNEQECSNGDDDDDDDDGESCTSSDLFELDNIGIVGMGSSNEELPVYGTTKLTRNQAFATMVVV